MIRAHRPVVIVLLGSRISGAIADGICKKFGKKIWIRTEANGFSGSIWMFSNQGEIQLKVLHIQKQFIHASVTSAAGQQWDFTAVYANPRADVRSLLWVGV